MLEKAYFQIIVPVSYDRNDFPKVLSMKNRKSLSKNELQDTDRSQKDTDRWFSYCFFPKEFSCTSQMEGSPLLEDAFCERFELAQVQRRSVGLHKNENYPYVLKRENISFQIGKIRLLFTNMGIAFICMEIYTEQLDEQQVLDFNALLRDIKRNPKFSYKTSVAKDEYVEKTTGLKDVVKSIIQMQSYIKLSEYKGETFSSTYRLLYITGSIHKEKLPEFFEICRNSQKSTEFPDDSVAQNSFTKYCLMVRGYLYFVVGTKAVIGYADLRDAGTENQLFLTDAGGLEKSISENYLLVYVYMISILLCIKRMDEETAANNPDLVKKIIKWKRKDLSNVVHINRLFEEYLAERAEGWFLEEKIQDIKESYLKADNNSDVAGQVKNAVDVIIEKLDQMNEKMDKLLGFVQNDLKHYLSLERKRLKEDDIIKEDETRISLLYALLQPQHWKQN